MGTHTNIFKVLCMPANIQGWGIQKKIQDLGIQTHVRLLDTNTHIQDLEVQKHILGLEDTNTCTQRSGIQT